MKKFLLLSSFMFTLAVSAQNNANICAQANSLCGALGEPFLNTSNSPPAENTINYGCLATAPNPAWFYLPVSQGGMFNFMITQTNLNGQPIDVDYICFGPFTSVAQGCATAGAANQIGCSYSAAAVENVTIPNAVAGQYYLIMVTNYSNMEGYITINDTGSSTAALDCSGINMVAFLDNNNNGTREAGEQNFPLGNFTYEANNDGNVHVVTTADGEHTLYDEVLANTYNLGFNINPAYTGFYSLATPFYTNVAVQPGALVETYNFPVTITQPCEDLAVYVIPTVSPVPGFTYTNTVAYANLGNQALASGTVSFTKDPAVSIIDVSQPGTVPTAGGFDYTFANLQPFETRTFTVTMQVPVIPTIALGDLFTSTAAITGAAGTDNTPENNTSVSTQPVIGAYDPNDKMESRGKHIKISEFGNDDYLYYTIRFQNTGTANAINVRVEDMLEGQLDYSTVEMIKSSHTYTMDRLENQLVWTFDNIMLPAETSDEAGSHGYVYFKVKPAAGFAAGNIILNAAEIYFDFNPAIVTNTFTTEFTETLGLADYKPGSFMMYPNPAKQFVNIHSGTGMLKSVNIYDISGKTIYTGTNTAANLVIDLSAFGTGLYFVEVINDGNNKTVKKLMVK